MMNEFVCDECEAEFSMDARYGMVSTCTECGSEDGPRLVGPVWMEPAAPMDYEACADTVTAAMFEEAKQEHIEGAGDSASASARIVQRQEFLHDLRKRGAMKDYDAAAHPRTHEEWAARGVVWTKELPPTMGHYWWIRPGACMPTVAWLYTENVAGEGWLWETVDSDDVYDSATDNGLWWPVPLVMPPPVGMYPWGVRLPEYMVMNPDAD